MKLTDIVGRPKTSGHKSILGKRLRWPPFSIFSARDGDWQDRKRSWISLGIKSELGRGEALTWDGQIGEDIDTYRHREAGITYQSGASGDLRVKFHASPGTAPLPAMDYSNKERGNGSGKPFHAHPGGGGPSKKNVWLNGSGKPVGGADALNGRPGDEHEVGQSGTSIFDPVLCELYYRWFTPINGVVLDPFAGGSVRGVVASVLGRSYIGLDLRKKQIKANEQQAERICRATEHPIWFCEDSRNIGRLMDGYKVDTVFSCPPYGDLETYSDDSRDLSTMTWLEFKAAYKEIIKQSVSVLKDNRFACFVVGDLRDKEGFFRNLPGYTIGCFEEAGCRLYNQAALVTVVGSLPLRTYRQFNVSRKLGNTHQYVLVFCKGNPRIAAAACEPLDTISQDIGIFNEN